MSLNDLLQAPETLATGQLFERMPDFKAPTPLNASNGTETEPVLQPVAEPLAEAAFTSQDINTTGLSIEEILLLQAGQRI